MAAFIRDTDPYGHHIVHAHMARRAGAHLPAAARRAVRAHRRLAAERLERLAPRSLQWIDESAQAGKPWVVAHDEQDPHHGAAARLRATRGFDGIARPQRGEPAIHLARRQAQRTLWGTLMAGGAGVEYYFGYTLPQNDLVARTGAAGMVVAMGRAGRPVLSRACGSASGDAERDELIGNPTHDDSRYCLADPGVRYVGPLRREARRRSTSARGRGATSSAGSIRASVARCRWAQCARCGSRPRGAWRATSASARTG